jgi:hypothetical protein
MDKLLKKFNAFWKQLSVCQRTMLMTLYMARISSTCSKRRGVGLAYEPTVPNTICLIDRWSRKNNVPSDEERANPQQFVWTYLARMFAFLTGDSFTERFDDRSFAKMVQYVNDKSGSPSIEPED